MSRRAKWLSVQALHLELTGEGSASTCEKIDGLPTRVGGRVSISRLVNGTEGGKSVAVFQIDLDDGTTVMFECSVGLLVMAGVAFQARDEAEGRPV